MLISALLAMTSTLLKFMLCVMFEKKRKCGSERWLSMRNLQQYRYVSVTESPGKMQHKKDAIRCKGREKLSRKIEQRSQDEHGRRVWCQNTVVQQKAWECCVYEIFMKDTTQGIAVFNQYRQEKMGGSMHSQHSTARHSTAKHGIAQHSTIQLT